MTWLMDVIRFEVIQQQAEPKESLVDVPPIGFNTLPCFSTRYPLCSSVT